MKRKRVWLGVGVLIAIALLMYWLFAGTLLEEEANPAVGQIAIEQN